MAQVNKKKTRDEIVQEMRKVKESLAEAMEFDIDRILEDARNKQTESGREILFPPVRQSS